MSNKANSPVRPNSNARGVKKAVIPAAGRGTRFLPITKACAKELLPIIDRPVMDYIIDEIKEGGIADILIIINKDKENIRKYYEGREDVKISFVYQDSPKGSGDAILYAESFADGEPFAVLLGDDIIYNPERSVTAQLVEAYSKVDTTIVGVQERLTDDIYKYGIIDCDSGEGRLYKMRAILEKPTFGSPLPSRMCALGRYVFKSHIFDILRKTPVARNGELQLTDGINLLCQGEIYAYDFEGRRYDMGDKLGSLEGIVEYALRREDLGADFKKYLEGLMK